MTAARSASGGFAGPGVIIRENADGSTLRWPDVIPPPEGGGGPGGFVHVRESDRSLSPALTDHFLPTRRYLMGLHLCADLKTAAEAEISTPKPDEGAYAMAAGPLGEAVSSDAGTPTRYIDTVVAAYGTGQALLAQPELTAPNDEAGGPQGSDQVQRDGLRALVARTIDTARRLESEQPGAFVEQRRPH